MKQIIPNPGENLLDLGKRCNAVYVCPRNDLGIRTGPMVAYAGKDANGKNLVGDIYFNFRRIEEHPEVVKIFAAKVFTNLVELRRIHEFDTICGIPHGGRTFGQMLALMTGKRFVYADKKPKSPEPGKKQEYTWDLSQFEFEKGEKLAVAEDVFNNFQNTDNTLEQVGATGAEVVLLVGALNRSPVFYDYYTPKDRSKQKIPIVASIQEPFPEYEQGDHVVEEHLETGGRIEFEVKANWYLLMRAMDQ